MAELKQKLSEKTGIDSEYIQLVYCTKFMKNKAENTLADYNLQNGSNITIVMRLPGGMEVWSKASDPS